jgi:hypothetical protein
VTNETAGDLVAKGARLRKGASHPPFSTPPVIPHVLSLPTDLAGGFAAESQFVIGNPADEQ